MPKQVSSDRAGRGDRAKYNGYVKCVLSEVDHEAIDAIMGGDLQALRVDMSLWESEVATYQYQVRLDYRPDWEEFTASLYCKDADDDNYGYILSASGETDLEAKVSLRYKHEAVYKDGQWYAKGPSRKRR